MRPLASTESHVRFPLSLLFSGPGAVRVLRIFALQQQPISLPSVQGQAKLSRNGAALILHNLTTLRVVQVFGSGRTQLYQLDPGYPLAGALRALFVTENQQWTELLQAVRRVLEDQPKVKAAWYFGSVARGEDTPRSDFDIGLVVPDDRQVDILTDSVREALQPIGERFFVAFSVIGLSDSDVVRLHRQQDEWWRASTHDARTLKGANPRDYAESITT
ncbi:MAG: hypothetical protein JWR22_4256 [Herminiimonas sp.]|nr:hypothetical protein [Herminiimonas sp.]